MTTASFAPSSRRTPASPRTIRKRFRGSSATTKYPISTDAAAPMEHRTRRRSGVIRRSRSKTATNTPPEPSPRSETADDDRK
jgi:hypothetical protein